MGSRGMLEGYTLSRKSYTSSTETEGKEEIMGPGKIEIIGGERGSRGRSCLISSHSQSSR